MTAATNKKNIAIEKHNEENEERVIQVRSTSGLDTNSAFVLNSDYPIAHKYGQIGSAEITSKIRSIKDRNSRIQTIDEGINDTN